MTARNGFDDLLAGWLEERAVPEPVGLHRASIAALHDVPQRSSWWARLAMTVPAPTRPNVSPALMTVIGAGLLLALVGMGLLIGTRPRTLPLSAVVASPAPTALASTPAGAWHRTAPMVARHHDPTATLLADGRVLVVGGDAEIYDPATDTWAATTPPRLPRSGHVAVRLDDGDVLIAGGISDLVDGPLASVERFHPADETWTEVAPMPNARAQGMTASLLPDGTVLVAGGVEFAAVPAADRFDPATGMWTEAPMIHGRSNHTATVLADGTVVVTGGEIIHDAALTSTERFHADSSTWTPEPDMGEGRTRHSAVQLDDGSLLVVGGTFGVLEDHSVVAFTPWSPTTERLAPGGNTWDPAGSLATGRAYEALARSQDGSVLAIGGANEGGPLDTVERYDPVAGSWSAAASLAVRRTRPNVAVLLDGSVLVVGGDEISLGAGDVTTAERFDPDG